MPAVDVPFLGSVVLCLTLVAAAYTFAVSLSAGRGRASMLLAARYGTYATCALVVVAVCLLAYAFQNHDFRIRYVARYSDRSMPWWYLVTSLWGGQDGSLLWWSFLLSGWTVACVRWMKHRYLELQPWVIATLMSILMFFHILMLWAANPFSTTVAVTPHDGEGLNPLLQNYWMVIHPPSLYMGFVGWSIPFAFAMAALLSGRVHDEWIVAIRKWVLAAWLFLSIGLLLGMLWSYEELGWGGYWAWDPVENASFMPWLVGTAFLHSVMIQERYGMLKVWNFFLICLTFFMTIFGTFLTRSGLIASVHSFARSEIGIYFVWYMAFLIVACFALIVWRLPKLKAVHRIESLLSREFAFLLNNWIFLAMMVFVLVLTTFPLLSEWLQGEEVTVGPPVYNRWMVPFGVVLMVLAGVGPLISWRKATGKNLMRAFLWPTVVAVLGAVLHVGVGASAGFPAFVETPAIYGDTALGAVLGALSATSPVAAVVACLFVLATIWQEFWRGTRVRMKNKEESPWIALVQLVSRAKRRYGGYIVHVGMVLMYVGFAGAAYDVEKEAALKPGASMEVGAEGWLRHRYSVRYDQVRTEADPNKRMIFTDMTILDEGGKSLASVAPAKFVYTTHPEMPTTEVAIQTGLVEDLYVIMSTVDPETRLGTFRVVVRPGVMWIWFGGIVLVLGTFIAMFPSVRELIRAEEREPRPPISAAATTAILWLVGLAFLGLSAPASAQDSSSLHAGTVVMHTDEERVLFNRLLCMCGDCQRLTLANCGCSWAENARAELRMRMDRGASPEEIEADYRARHGQAAISVPADEGLGRAMWAVPVGLGVMALGGIIFLGRRWKRRTASEAASAPERAESSDPIDDRLEDELRKLEG